MVKIYMGTNSDKMQTYISAFEQASTGATVKETLIAALDYLNTLHKKKFGTS